jgi:hypothetical protein
MLMPLNPMHFLPAGCAVQDELAETPFEFGFGPQEFEPQHLGGDRDGVIGGKTGLHGLVDEVIRLRCLLGD